VPEVPTDPGQVAPATPAATVVPLRDGESGLEVLLLRRASGGVFGGMWVFPGGQVDPGDLADPDAGAGEAGADPEAGAGAAGPYDIEVAAARRAAVREAREEAGLDLRTRDLVTLSFWLPPPEAPRRFATWFFLAAVGGRHPVVIDAEEIHEHRWQSPAGAMASRNAGQIELVPPTFATLWKLSQHHTAAAALAAAAAAEPGRFTTRMALGAGTGARAALWDGDAGYPDGDADRPGPRRRLWLDPEGWHMEIT
jgi:8-oxo-dGTP pyrophosphatase MutT (NUDIX family)